MQRLPQAAQDIQQRKILYMGLYLLIWGEAANIRFMPECLCYIFHNVSITFWFSSFNFCYIGRNQHLSLVYAQMAYELHGLLAGNVSIVTGENIKPSYGGDDEAFLRKVITPIYRVVEKVAVWMIGRLQLKNIDIVYTIANSFLWIRKQIRMRLAKLLTQIGPTMMTWTNISGIFELKSVNWTFTWLGHLDFLVLFTH